MKNAVSITLSPVVQSNSLNSIDAVIELIASSEYNTKATSSKTRLLVKVSQVSGHIIQYSVMT